MEYFSAATLIHGTMPCMTDTRTLRLDGRVTRVWRNPHCVQFGIDEPLAVIDAIGTGHEKLLDALRIGTGLHGLRAIGSHHGLTHRDIDDLLAALGPVLTTSGPASPAGTTDTSEPQQSRKRAPRVSILGTSPTATELARLLTAAEIEVHHDAGTTVGSPRTDLGIIIDHFVIHPDHRAVWLRHDTPHLPIVWGDRGVHIGPFIEPGNGPCLHCLERHRTEADPAWPAIASQLIDRHSSLETPILAADTALTSARLVLERLRSGPCRPAATRIDRDGQRTTIEVARHPECGCRSLADLVALPPNRPTKRSATPHRARRETATPRGRRAATTATTTHAVADEPA